MKNIKTIQLAVILLLCTIAVQAQVYNIKDFGAIADGHTLNTIAIQKTIDKCAETGGQVVVPSGIFRSGTVHLKSRVNLYIQDGGVLQGSPSFNDYPDNEVHYQNAFTHTADGKAFANKAFLFAEGVHDISISGKGTIDGSGDSPEFNLGNDDTPRSRLRPCMLLILDSQHSKVEGLTLRNSAYWLQNYLGCQYLELKNLTIYNQSNYNQDGIDIDASHVLVENCKIDVDDDGICLKSHDRSRMVEDITIRNCSISSNCNAIKFGTKSMAGLKNVNISHISIQKASADHIRHWQQNLKFIDQPVTVISGISLESVDGAVIDHINISDVTMQDVQTPIFIVLGNRGNKQAGGKAFYSTTTDKANLQPVGAISNINIKNITATAHSKMASSITAFPGYYAQNIKLTNIIFNNMGGGTKEEAAKDIPENPGAYPENRMYGQVYPASGWYFRHVQGLTLSNIKLSVSQADFRPAIALDDVQDSKFIDANIEAPGGNIPVINIKNSKGITIIRPVINASKNPLIQLNATPRSTVNVIGFKKYPGWLIE
jgi:polygalacturonase